MRYRRVRKLQQPVIGLLKGEFGQVRVACKLQLRVGDLHVVLGFSKQVGIAGIYRHALQRGKRTFEISEAGCD